MKRWGLRALIFALILALPLPNTALAAANTPAFSDIAGHWAQDVIERGVRDGLVLGYPDGTFRPYANISRVEVVKIVNKMTNRVFDTSITTGLRNFTDVSKDYWGYNDIMEATNAHDFTIVDGKETWTNIR